MAEHFAAFKQEILGFLRSRVATPEQADDLLQQTFLRVLQRADWSTVDNPRAYLHSTARHVLVDFYRQNSAQKNQVPLEFLDHQHEDKTWSPTRTQTSNEFMLRLADTLETMTSRVRTAFVLSRVYGYTYAEIGKVMSISPRTVEKHVAKGLAHCFAHMNDVRADVIEMNGASR